MGISPEDAREQAKYWREQYLHQKKCCMIYEAYLDKHFIGYLDGYQDLITDAIITCWPEEKLDWEKAKLVTKNWLEPTLEKILRKNRCIGNP